MTPRFADSASLAGFLEAALSGRRVYGVVAADGGQVLRPIEARQAPIPPCRADQPLKPLFFPPRYAVGRYFGTSEQPAAEPRAIVGATACDLAALGVLDYVFLEGDFVDPFYEAARRNTLVVSVDCSEPRESCFCTFLGRQPFPEGGYDLNLSPLEDGYLIEWGSEEGRRLLGSAGCELPEAAPRHFAERESRRGAVAARVGQRVADAGLPAGRSPEDLIRAADNSALWDELAERCVECGACNFICPTCHCFLLVDLQEREGFRRFRDWDACLYPGFAREASGANPRARRAQRLHGRLEKKFQFMKANAGTWGCVGCGRCVEACAGGIDLRETLRELAHA